MPTYDYQCSLCSEKLEISQKITAEPVKDCPACGRPALVRGPGGGAGLLFKGNGFYITDYGPRKKDSGTDSNCKSGTDSSCCPCSGV